MSRIAITPEEVQSAARNVHNISGEITGRVSDVRVAGGNLRNEATALNRSNQEINTQLGKVKANRAAIESQLSAVRNEVVRIQASWQGASQAGFQDLANRWQNAATRSNAALDEWELRARELNAALEELQKKNDAMNAALEQWTREADQLSSVLSETGTSLDRVAVEFTEMDRRIGGAFSA